QTVPYRWIEPLMPESAEPPEYRAYYDALDKARAQLAAGQYRRVLVTLRTAGEIDASEAAVVRSSALTALGRFDEALQAVSPDAAKAHPAIAVARANTLCA